MGPEYITANEKRVLLGAIKTIKTYYPVIQMENTNEQVKWGKGKENDAEEYLFFLGYKKVKYRYKYKDFIYVHQKNRKSFFIKILEFISNNISDLIAKFDYYL